MKKKCSYLVIICIIATSCNNISSGEKRKPSPESSIINDDLGNKQTVLYSGFLFPTVVNGFSDLPLDIPEALKNASPRLDVLENVKRDSLESIPFYWVKTKQVESNIPDFHISRFRLPQDLHINGNKNSYDLLNQFAVFIGDSLDWKYGSEYSIVNLSDEESYWRYISIRISGDSITFLGGVQLLNYLTVLNDNNEVQQDFFLGDDFTMWYSTKVVDYQSQMVSVLYKVIEHANNIYVAVELDSENTFGEISEMLHNYDEGNGQRRHLLM